MRDDTHWIGTWRAAPAPAEGAVFRYDCGDHLHPSDLGYRTMGDVIDLSLLD